MEDTEYKKSYDGKKVAPIEKTPVIIGEILNSREIIRLWKFSKHLA